jgi:thioredoxin reductase (NADPH)
MTVPDRNGEILSRIDGDTGRRMDAGCCEDVGRKITIIGAGPAGVAAAVQLKRGGFDPLVFERDRVGGLLREANLVENYPGFPDGIAGHELADLMAAHLRRAGVKIMREEVTLLERSSDAFSVRTPSGVTIAETVVIASGTRPKVLHGVRVSDRAEKRVRYGIRGLEGVCDGKVAVIGGSEAAFDYALNMARHNDVVILHRSAHPRCIPVLRERCDASHRITYHSNTTVKEISASRNGVILQCVGQPAGEMDHVAARGSEHGTDRTSAGGSEHGTDHIPAGGSKSETKRIAADYVIVAIGRMPCLGFLSSGLVAQLDVLRKAGLLYLIGDVINGTLRQAAISAGDGVRAAMEILARGRAYEPSGGNG